MQKEIPTPMTEYRRAQFTIDSIAGAKYEGYTDDREWNGFATPLFEYDTAIRVLRDSQPNGFRWVYDEQRDTFVVEYELQPDDEPEEFDGTTIRHGGDDI